MVDVTRASGVVWVRVDGPFDDVAAGSALHDASADRVVLDLAHADGLHDVDLAAVVRALTRTEAHVVVRGLGRHQLRVLRYLGVDAPEPTEENDARF